MKSKKPRKPEKDDKTWHKQVEERLKIEKVELSQPKGKERFEKTLKQALKKNKR